MTNPAGGTPLPPEKQGKLADANIASLSRLESAMYGLITGSADRARAAVDTLQKASAAILAIYTGLLALVFSTGSPLPLRGIVAGIFLGLAVVLSTVYLAFIGAGKTQKLAVALPGGQESRVFQQLAFYAQYVSLIVNRRSWALRSSVVALGFGLIAISFPFLSSSALGLATASSSAKAVEVDWPESVPAGLPDRAAGALFEAQIETAIEEAEAANAKKPGFVEEAGFVWLTIGIGLASVAAAAVFPVRRADGQSQEGVPVVELES